MDDQLRPVEAGVGAPLDPHPFQHEREALCEVDKIITRARAEYHAGCPIAARLEISRAISALTAVMRGEAV
ncbi:hypothetical protein [Brevundimonas sp.]|uniref:hypothetical protein n=1 Tax=Brevundimonas sp. TaxID=1871086 RepID=UPI0035ADC640